MHSPRRFVFLFSFTFFSFGSITFAFSSPSSLSSPSSPFSPLSLSSPSSPSSGSILIKDTREFESLRRLELELKDQSTGLDVIQSPNHQIFRKLGMTQGDRILAINNIEVHSYSDLKKHYHESLLEGKTMKIKIRHQGRITERTISLVR